MARMAKTASGATLVPFAFDMRQQVVIKLTARPGEVRGLWLDENGNRWVRVYYANEVGSLHEDWFIEDDVTAAQPLRGGTAGARRG